MGVETHEEDVNRVRQEVPKREDPSTRLRRGTMGPRFNNQDLPRNFQ